MRKVQVVRRQRSGWFALWLWALIGWTVYCGWTAVDLGARADRMMAQPGTAMQKAGTRIGATLGYNAGINRIVSEWLLVSAVLGLLMFLSRGVVVIDETWVDEKGRTVRPPRQPPQA